MVTLIISGGSLDYDFAKRFLSEHRIDVIIAADKGMEFCYEQGIEPDYILGDYDSVQEDIVAFYREQTQVKMETYQSEKDDTDTEIAMKKALSLGSGAIYILGAMGGRMDHFLANLHLLCLALQEGVQAYLADPRNLICLIDKPAVLKKQEQEGDYVSFLPFTDEVEGITLRGFKYPLDGYLMTKGSSIGISNEIAGREAEVTFDRGVLIMIQSKD